MIKKFYRGP